MVLRIGGAEVGRVSSAEGRNLQDGEEVQFSLDSVTVSGLGLPEDASGLLTVTNCRVCWCCTSTDPRSAHGDGVSIPLEDIALHAISRDASSGTNPCIYMQVGNDDDEFRLFPSNADEDLCSIFDAMSAASALCMNGAFEDDGSLDNNEQFYTGESSAAAEMLRGFDRILDTTGSSEIVNGFGKEHEVPEDSRLDDRDGMRRDTSLN